MTPKYIKKGLKTEYFKNIQSTKPKNDYLEPES